MNLFHWTQNEKLESILANGLRTNGMGIIYLTPDPTVRFGDCCLVVSVDGKRLSAFEDCSDWEILCWDDIEPARISKREESWPTKCPKRPGSGSMALVGQPGRGIREPNPPGEGKFDIMSVEK